MKLNRLIEIVMILLNKKTVTAKDLAARFGVSVRTIYRDVEDLSAAGIPVYMSKGNGGGISLLDGYSINKAILTQSDRENLEIALKTMQTTEYPEIDKVMEKMKALFNSNNTNAAEWVTIDFTGWNASPIQDGERNKFIDVKNAILNSFVIKFDYINSNGEKSVRFVEPCLLLFKTYTWYLTGFCRNRNEFRIFRLSRIKNVSVTNERFEKRANPHDERTPDFSNAVMLNLHLRFNEKVLFRFYDEFDDGLITKTEDGFELQIDFPESELENEWIYSFILSLGENVEVISPKPLRKAVIKRVKKTLKNYEN